MGRLYKDERGRGGFTIVELLIVIVVIAILAAITIVSYNGISRRAEVAQMKSYLQSAAKAASTFRASSPDDTYPDTLSAKVVAPASLTTQYSVNGNKNDFCITAKTTKGDEAHITSSGTVGDGSCLDGFGLVARWRFNGNLTDSSPSPITPVSSSGVSSTIGQNGQVGGAYNFTAGSFINLGDTQKLNALKTMTVSVWIKLAPGSAWRIAFSLDNGLNSIYAGVSGNKPDMSGMSSQGWVDAEQWTHMVYTVEHPSGKLWFYKDGSLLGSYDAVAPYTPTSYNKRAFIGTLRYETNSTSLGYASFQGALDDLRLYDRLLTSSEIAQLYSMGAQ